MYIFAVYLGSDHPSPSEAGKKMNRTIVSFLETARIINSQSIKVND